MFQLVYPATLLLFWAFTAGALLLPLRWAFVCLLLAANVNIIQPGFSSSGSIGWQNAVETLLLPTLLLVRMVGFRIPRIRWGFSAKAWMALILYAAVSILWSPFKLSGVKMVAYLVAWFIFYLVFHLAWRRKIVDERLVTVALWAALALAYLQTYLMSNPEQAATHQFTSFTAAGTFALFVLSALAFLLFRRGQSGLRAASIAACLLAIVLSGDRTALIGLACLLFVWFLYWRRAVGTTEGLRLAPAIPVLLLCTVLFLGFRATMGWAMPQSRLNQFLQLGSGRATSIQDIGTAAFRLEMYEKTLSEVANRSIPGLFFGSGTSSGAEVAFRWERGLPTGLDPNRVIHDEFLRALYEWGLIGLALGLVLVVRLVRRTWLLAVRQVSLPALAALGLIPAILLVLIDGNPLAGPGSAAGVGFALVLSRGLLRAESPSFGRAASPLIRQAQAAEANG